MERTKPVSCSCIIEGLDVRVEPNVYLFIFVSYSDPEKRKLQNPDLLYKKKLQIYNLPGQ
jgi:hypothetical protein